MGKLKNGIAVSKNKFKGELIKSEDDRRMCNLAFENGVVPEDWRSA